MWTANGVDYRIELSVTLDDALEIVGSLHPFMEHTP